MPYQKDRILSNLLGVTQRPPDHDIQETLRQLLCLGHPVVDVVVDNLEVFLSIGDQRYKLGRMKPKYLSLLQGKTYTAKVTITGTDKPVKGCNIEILLYDAAHPQEIKRDHAEGN